MKLHVRRVGLFSGFLRATLCLAMASAPSAQAWCQGYGAQQAVRERVQGLDSGPVEAVPREAPPGLDQYVPRPRPSGSEIDIAFVAPGAAAVLVLRPAQIMSAPGAEMLPTEVATAAGKAYLGIDPKNVDEIVAFVNQPDAAGLAYSVMIKFNQPFRAASIPPHARPAVQLSELAGRKYWQSSHPLWPSFYGTDRQTMILAPDVTLLQLVETIDQPKSGPLLDLVNAAQSGNDLYLAVDIASLRPLIPAGLIQAGPQIPPQALELSKLLDSVAVVELTLNLSEAGPSWLVVHGTDEAAAQQLESTIAQLVRQQEEKMRATFAEQSAGDDPVQQALAQYMERMSTQWAEKMRPQRQGTALTFFHPESQDPSKKQVLALAAFGVAVGLLMPAVQAARDAARGGAETEASEGLDQPPEGFGQGP